MAQRPSGEDFFIFYFCFSCPALLSSATEALELSFACRFWLLSHPSSGFYPSNRDESEGLLSLMFLFPLLD